MLRMGEEQRLRHEAPSCRARSTVAKAARDERVAEARAGKKAEIERRRHCRLFLDQLIRDADALDYEEEEKQPAEAEAKRAEEEARRIYEHQCGTVFGWQCEPSRR